MLAQPFRDLLTQTFMKVLTVQVDGQNFFNAVQPGIWNAVVPTSGTSYTNAVVLLVDIADGQNWLRALVQRLVDTYPTRPEFKTVLDEIDRTAPVATVTNPFDEVLLAGNRPFADRQPLRAALLDLTNSTGSPVLLIDGEPKTGKTFSYYFISHVAPTKNYIVSRFIMARQPKPDELAEEILGRIGVTRTLQPIGNESAERWAEKLADTVKDAIEEKQTPRLFVFDEFPVTKLPDGSVVEIPLPPGTASFIVRLARYADEELRSYLRVVLMRFRGELPPELDDVALRENVQSFTSTHMVAVVMQVAKARNWSVTEATVKAKIDQYHQTPGRTLNDKFKFLRGLLAELSAAPS